MDESIKRAKETSRKEFRSEPLEKIIDDLIAKQVASSPSPLMTSPYLEVPDKMVMTYKYSLGGISRFFVDLRDKGVLSGTICTSCGFRFFPPRVSCSECYGDTEWYEVNPDGVVITSSTSWYATSEFFDKVPYAVAYVKPSNADTGMLQRIDLAGRTVVEPGTRVRVVFREKRNGSVSDFWYVIEG